MEPRQVTTILEPFGGDGLPSLQTPRARIVWADTGEPLGQRQWPQRPSTQPVPGPTGGPMGTPTAGGSLLATLRDVAHIPGLPDPHVGKASSHWSLRQRERLEAEATAPSGRQLREWREALGLSQRDAAALCGLGRGIVAMLELDRRRAPLTRQKVGAILRRELGLAER